MGHCEESMKYVISEDGNGWGIFDGTGEAVSVLSAGQKPTGVVSDGEQLCFDLTDRKCAGDSFEFQYSHPGWEMRDTVKILKNGFYIVERQWKNKGGSEKDAVFVFDLVTGFEPDFYLIPCVSYNGNQWGNGNEPKGLLYNGSPWVFAYDRTGLPAATFSENGKYAVGLFASDENASSLVSSCSLSYEGKRLKHRILWPDREEPVTYAGRDSYGDPVKNSIRLPGGGTFTVRLYILISDTEKKNFGWTKAYDRAIDILQRSVRPVFNAETVWKSRIRYIKEVQFISDGEISLTDMGLLPQGEFSFGEPGMKFKSRIPYEKYEIGWCGQNALQANALIYDYILNGDRDSLDKGTSILDTWSKRSRIGNGLFYIYFEDVLENRRDAQLDTCNLGWGAWQMLEAYENVKSLGLDRTPWLDMGLELCDFFLKNRASDRTFGKAWNIEGKCMDEGGTVGCYVLLPMIKAFTMTGREDYLKCAEEVYGIYADRDLASMQCTAGALDTCCVDKETCWPLLKTGLDLYELTGKEYYLQEAKYAGYYLLSWMYHYDILYDGESEFEQYGYHTYGGTAVSAQHHHLDPWGGLICYDWLRLFKHTGDLRWKARFHAAWTNSLLCVSDGNLVVHGITRPLGSQNEAFLHCNWCYDRNAGKKRGCLNDWLQSWPGAFKLLNLMREKDWSVFDAGEPVQSTEKERIT